MAGQFYGEGAGHLNGIREFEPPRLLRQAGQI